MIDKVGIASRLKEYLVDKYRTIKAGAEVLNTSADTLYSSYLNGRSVPGGELLISLIKDGCDVGWLLTGIKSDELLQEKIKILTADKDALQTTLDTISGMANDVNNVVREQTGSLAELIIRLRNLSEENISLKEQVAEYKKKFEQSEAKLQNINKLIRGQSDE
ncbi:MAG: hypothetical protein IPM56_16060 [Ignavibacteriales bacterium]|nr:MAG: hypothetical protein IPM56_16060 [Ignavibacteriales bacterium]